MHNWKVCRRRECKQTFLANTQAILKSPILQLRDITRWQHLCCNSNCITRIFSQQQKILFKDLVVNNIFCNNSTLINSFRIDFRIWKKYWKLKPVIIIQPANEITINEGCGKWVCVWAWKIKSMCVCVQVSVSLFLCVCACARVWEREIKNVCVCVCLRVRDGDS